MKGTMLVIGPDGQTERTEVETGDDNAILDMWQKAVDGWVEKVPHFASIEVDGKVHRCIALCNEEGKFDKKFKNSHGPLPMNSHATDLWAQSLRRDFGVVSPMPDYLVGNVVVMFGDDEFLESL